MQTSSVDAAARLLYEARTLRQQPIALPDGARPESYESAYAIQAGVARLIGRPVQGWKIGAAPDGRAIAAPLYTITSSDAELDHQTDVAVETELALLLNTDLAPRARPYGREEVAAAIEHCVVCFEIAASRLAGRPGHFAALADDLANVAVVLGAGGSRAVPGPGAMLDVALDRDGAALHGGAAPHRAGDVLAPLVDYLNVGGDLLGGLRRGHVVITGSLTGLSPAPPGSVFTGRVAGFGRVAARFKEEA